MSTVAQIGKETKHDHKRLAYLAVMTQTVKHTFEDDCSAACRSLVNEHRTNVHYENDIVKPYTCHIDCIRGQLEHSIWRGKHQRNCFLCRSV